MKTLFFIALLAEIWISIQCSKTSKQGYILTAPSVFDSNATETICLTLNHFKNDGIINVKLQTSTKVVSSQQYHVKDSSRCFSFNVGETFEKEAVLSISGTFKNGYTFSNKKNVKIKQSSDLIIVQCDKHMYKPGQKVQFRVLHLTRSFLPSANSIQSIRIENPMKVHVSQWMLPSFKKGLADLNFQLSDHPQLGTWAIFVVDKFNNEFNKTFVVAEYVLPEFSVKIIPPTTILPDFQQFDWKVCAYYTYGEPVTGYIKANISFKSIINEVSPPLTAFQDEFRECSTITVQKQDLKLNSNGILIFYAEVSERGTGNAMSDFKQKEIKSPHFHLYYRSKRYFKPGLAYQGKLLIETNDGTPVQGIELKFVISIFSSRGSIANTKLTLKSNEKGLIEFQVAPQGIDKEMIQIDVTSSSNQVMSFKYFGFSRINGTEIKSKDTITDYIKSWSSPSDSFIQIEGSTETFKCNRNYFVTVKYIVEDAKDSPNVIYYQILSRGNVVTQETIQIKQNNLQQESISKQNSFRISVTVEANLSPKFQMIIYYIRQDGEIVSDSETFEVEECLANKVDMKYSKTKVLPGSLVNLQLTADPNSICATEVTDFSTKLLSNYEFNAHTIFTKLRDHHPAVPIVEDDAICNYFDPLLGRFQRNKRKLGSVAAFNTIGLLTMTDLRLDSSPCQPRISISTGARKTFSAFDNLFDVDIDNYIDQIEAENEDEYDETSMPAVEMRNIFPETWLWDLIPMGADGKITLERIIPHTITKWTGSTFCISPQTGFGISPQSSIIAFQAVFLSYKIPYSVKLSETVPVTVSVFNYLRGCFPMVIALEQIQDFKLVSDSNEIKFCICGKKSHSHKYYIEPTTIGQINITARAHSMNAFTSSVCRGEPFVSKVMAYDSITKPLLVQVHGVPKETSHSSWICASGHTKTYKYPIKIPVESTPGTIKAFVTVTGDLVAPIMSHMDKLVTLPTGCGEQNMIRFAPLTFLLHYLTSTNQLTEAINKTAISHLKTGLQNQLKYKRNDGSFSAWGQRDATGSSWLTAFVIKSFYQAKNMIYIDPQLISNGIQFLINRQTATGCFKDAGVIIHREMQGGIGAGEKSMQAATLFITISLLESGLDSSNNVIKRAIDCIQSDKQPTLYRQVMQAYTAALANNHNLALSILKQLEPKAIIKGDMAFWAQNLQDSRAIQIEITSYMLLAMVTASNYHSDLAIKAVRWLIDQRNSHGGFVSTQETVVALQALEKYASKLSAKTVDVRIKLHTGRLTDEILINQENRLVIHKRNIPSSTTEINVDIAGHGCALIQVTVQYYTKSNHPSSAFYLDITVSPYTLQKHLNGQNKQTIKICTRYTNSDGKSNMAIIEIQMVSGYEADSSHLDKLINPGTNLRKWEKGRDSTINLYLDELDQNLKCFNILVTEKTEVLNRKPATIAVYDYYRPNLKISKEYTLLAKSSNTLLNENKIILA